MDTYKRQWKRDSLLPIIKSPEVESTWYCLRLAPLGKYGTDEVVEFLNLLSDSWIMGKEHSEKEKLHFHIAILCSKDEDELRECVRVFLKVYWPEKGKRGDGNLRYNLQTAYDMERAIKYAIKDKGDKTFGTNINPEFIERCSKEAFKKLSKETFTKMLETLRNKFMTTPTMTMNEYMVEFVQMKAELCQPINLNYIHQMAMSISVLRDKEEAYKFVGEFLVRQTPRSF